ncbi:nuclease A inhibitor family protein [Hymenobacter bucti]|uniref:Nuclease A inhibitor family protein n=1 Tax=Hymenobacter bucti TaxID=1844114 RepID=A0ABW4R182_9BACT
MPDLLPELQRLTAGLLFMSESDAPLEVVNYTRPAGSLPNAALLQALGEPADVPTRVVTLAYFLRNHTAVTERPDRQPVVAQYQALQAFMEQHLQAAQVYRVGDEPRIRAYALGESEAGQLLGFKTLLIET